MATPLKNSLYYTVGSVLKALASFFLLPLFANILGSEQYGILNLLQTFSTILGFLMTLATERSLYRLYYDYKTDYEKKIFLSTVFWTITLLGLLILLATYFTGAYIVKYIGDVNVYRVLFPTILYTLIISIINYCQLIMQQNQDGAKYFTVSMLILILYNFASYLFLTYYSPTVDSLVYANLIADVLVLPYALWHIRKFLVIKYSWEILKDVFKFSFPVFFMLIFSWMLNTTDRLFIANIIDYKSAGVYSLASKIVQMSVLFVGAIMQAYSPYFYKITNSLTYEEAKNKLFPINNIIILFICFLNIVVVVFSKIVLDIFFDAEYMACLPYIFLLSFSGIFTQQASLINHMIFQNKKTIGVTIVNIFCGILSVVLNWLFIPKYGSVFAGISNLIVGVIMFISLYLIAKRNYYIPVKLNVFIMLPILFISFWGVDMFIDNVWFSLFINILLALIFALLLFVFRIVTINDVMTIYEKYGRRYINRFFYH